VDHERLERSPTLGLQTPREEKDARPYLQAHEYTRMLSLAGASPRDYAMLQPGLMSGYFQELGALMMRRRQGHHPIQKNGPKSPQ
jgi:hypothetical protein